MKAKMAALEEAAAADAEIAAAKAKMAAIQSEAEVRISQLCCQALPGGNEHMHNSTQTQHTTQHTKHNTVRITHIMAAHIFLLSS